MAENERFLKPQSPIQDGEDYILPITSFDQIIMPDGVSRWDGVSGSEAKVTVNGIEPDGERNIELNASDVGALPEDWLPSASDIADLQDVIDVSVEEAIESAGVVKTICGIIPDKYGDVELNASDVGALPEDYQVFWEDIQNIPDDFTPSQHEHSIDEIMDVSYEEWTFTLDDGSTVTKKVLICD